MVKRGSLDRHLHRAAGLLILCLVSVPCHAQEISQEAWLERARSLREIGDYPSALAVYDLALSSSSGASIEVLLALRLERGLLLIELGRSEAAEKDFLWIEEHLPPTSPVNRYFRALALSNVILTRLNFAILSSTDLALCDKALSEAVALTTEEAAPPEVRSAGSKLHAILTYLRGELLSRTDRATEAVATLASALSELPAESRWAAKARLLLGKLLANGPGWEEGLAYLHESLRIFRRLGESSDLADALTEIAYTERRHERRREVVQELRQISLAGRPQTELREARRLLDLAFIALVLEHDSAAAKRDIATLEERYPAQLAALGARYLLLQGQLAVTDGDVTRAREIIRRAEEPGVSPPATASEKLALRHLELKLARHSSDWKAALEIAVEIQLDLVRTDGAMASAYAADMAAYALVLTETSEIYLELGLADLGLHLSRRAVSLFEELGLSEEEANARFLYAAAWLSIDPYGRQEASGRPEWQRELEEMASRLPELSPATRTLFHVLYAQGLNELDRFEEAGEHLTRVDRNLLSEANLVAFELTRGQIALQRNDLTTAREALAAIEQAGAGDLFAQHSVAEFRARLAQRSGDPASELRAHREAIEISDRISSFSSALQFQSSIRDARAASYDQAIRCAARLAAIDPGTYRTVLLELVLSALVPPVPQKPTPLTDELYKMLSVLSGHRLLVDVAGNAVSQADARFSFHRTYLDYLARLPAEHTRVDSDRGRRVADFLLRRSQQEGTQTRVYYLGRDTGWIFILEHGTVRDLHRIDIDRLAGLPSRVAEWRSAILATRDLQERSRAVARELFATLFPDGLGGGAERLEIVPHGTLWDLPFESLVYSSPGAAEVAYLDEVREISYWAPSSLGRAESPPEYPNPSQKKEGWPGLFFVNPDLADESLPPLSTVAALADRLREAGLTVAQERFLSGPQAKESMLYRNEVQSAAWLHFATHSAAENAWEMHVGLLLGRDPDFRPKVVDLSSPEGPPIFVTDSSLDFRRDGFLSPREIQTLPLRAELVFLHGCQTSKGQVSFSAGPLGLVSAFLAAGARSVVASHWPVADRGEIAEEIARFYTRLLSTGEPAGASLRALRKALRERGGLAGRPYVWASFSVYR